jgi:hypothetical protein
MTPRHPHTKSGSRSPIQRGGASGGSGISGIGRDLNISSQKFKKEPWISGEDEEEGCSRKNLEVWVYRQVMLSLPMTVGWSKVLIWLIEFYTWENVGNLYSNMEVESGWPVWKLYPGLSVVQVLHPGLTVVPLLDRSPKCKDRLVERLYVKIVRPWSNYGWDLTKYVVETSFVCAKW